MKILIVDDDPKGFYSSFAPFNLAKALDGKG